MMLQENIPGGRPISSRRTSRCKRTSAKRLRKASPQTHILNPVQRRRRRHRPSHPTNPSSQPSQWPPSCAPASSGRPSPPLPLSAPPHLPSPSLCSARPLRPHPPASPPSTPRSASRFSLLSPRRSRAPQMTPSLCPRPSTAMAATTGPLRGTRTTIPKVQVEAATSV
ncbi:hypothetical protein M011DRAFT_250732 [Sporormia fimetaria CBS 119925]|uniref:Uncharacterized protein n=1 Tax=Sporormia fimetaria CBS 119925 TaxID=1340428 RepID=A0A6A6UZ88_9PLEO|nr:hypothetical protein M011DRAFT_250732 [Sporormia fimetaria CBS 119925]